MIFCKKSAPLFLLVFSLVINSVFSQNIGINNKGTSPASSAILDVDAINKGLLIPRLTSSQRDAIASPAAGLFLYNTTSNKLELWNGANWIQLSSTTIAATNTSGTNAGQSVAISSSSNAANPSAILDVQSTTGGLLIPRLNTNQRNSIVSPVFGLLIYNTDARLLHFYSNTGWIEVCGAVVSSATGSTTTPQNVGINTASPDHSAMLDVSSTSRGLAIPRMTSTQRDAILSPAQGLMLFNTTTQSINVYDGSGHWLNYKVAVPPASPTAATSTATSAQIKWKWNSVNGAAGYKWSTVQDYYSATDVGADTSYTQTGIACNTSVNVYVWAYNCNGFSQATMLTQSTTACGTTNACSWNGSTTFVDDRDNKTYTQVQIGTQCWMAQNLNYGTYTDLPTVSGIYQSAGQKYCGNVNCNGNDSTCPYGGFYQWPNLMNGGTACNGTGSSQPACTTPVQGLCPNGWHIPSHYEWTLLESAVGGGGPYDESSVSFFGSAASGNSLKTVGSGAAPLWSSGSNGTNTSGFSAMPAGLVSQHQWNGGPFETGFWTSSENTNSTLGCGPQIDACAWYHFIYSTIDGIARYIYAKQGPGLSVRCVKD